MYNVHKSDAADLVNFSRYLGKSGTSDHKIYPQDKTAELNEEKTDRTRAKDILLSDLRNTQDTYAKKKTVINNMTTKVGGVLWLQ